jgi:hypothetical protein
MSQAAFFMKLSFSRLSRAEFVHAPCQTRRAFVQILDERVNPRAWHGACTRRHPRRSAFGDMEISGGRFMEPRVKTASGGLVEGGQPKEGPVARRLESATSRLPSDVWLWASVGSMLVSLGLQLSGNRKTKDVSNFIGQWAPTLLILGLYNKLVKVAGHDRTDGPED